MQDIDEEDDIKQQRISEDEATRRLQEQTTRLAKLERSKGKVLHNLGFGDVEEFKEDLYLLH